MCNNCRELANTLVFQFAADFRDHVDQVRAAIADGKLTLESGNVALESIQRQRPLPADSIRLIFACPRCQQRFALSGAVYSERNATWQPI